MKYVQHWTVYCHHLFTAIYSAWKRYEKLYNEHANELRNVTGEEPLALYDQDRYAHVETVSIPIDFILEHFEELKVGFAFM